MPIHNYRTVSTQIRTRALRILANKHRIYALGSYGLLFFLSLAKMAADFELNSLRRGL
jgi:hypothetical protein